MTEPFGRRTVPLTLVQKARLLGGCMPTVFFAAVMFAYVTVLRDIYQAKLELLAFLAIVVLGTGYYARQRLRDIADGTAIVTEDRLRNILGRGSQRHRRHQHRGEFDQLGRLTLMRAAFRNAQSGRRHRVTYSPASRIVWSLEPL